MLGLNGGEVRDRFDEIENGLRGAIDFLRSSLNVEKLGNLPFPTLLIPLASFFAAPDGTDVKASQDQLDALKRWFWRAAISRRYSGDVQRRINADITEARKLRDGESSELANIPANVTAEWFLDNSFSFSAVNTKTFILMLASLNPRSFISGSPVDLAQVLKTYNRAEFHHIYPRKFLRSQGIDGVKDANHLANFAMISAADNRTIGGKAPSDYRARMPSSNGKLKEILDAAACPEEMFNDDYNKFLDSRSTILVGLAQSLIG